MKKFRRSEILFLLLGIILMSSSVVFLKYHISLVKFFNLHRKPGDPFVAAYYVAPVATPTPTPTPLPITTEDPSKFSIYLVSPPNQILMPAPKANAAPLKITFRYELYPKNTPSTFELLHLNQIVLKQEIPASNSNQREVSVELPGPGAYEWVVKALDTTSELRTFTQYGKVRKK